MVRPDLARGDASRDAFPTRSIELHGHQVTYREAGPEDAESVVLLLHGMAGSSRTWLPILPRLAERHRVVAPDLLGHGQSAKPRGDYSPGAFASGVRDLLMSLEHEHATVVGHSLGGGVALQFAYLFPQHCERLVLVGSGGLGRQVHPALQAMALPGAELALPLFANRHLHRIGHRLHQLIRRFPGRRAPAFDEIGRSYASLAETEARVAFVHTVRSCIDIFGQRIDARDRLYLLSHLPTLFVWGERDPVIPVRHGRRAAALAPGSQLEVFEGAGHWPHLDAPERFADVVLSFLERTEPSHRDAQDFHRWVASAAARRVS